jgi:hypothetical protein
MPASGNVPGQQQNVRSMGGNLAGETSNPTVIAVDIGSSVNQHWLFYLILIISDPIAGHTGRVNL